MKNFYLSLIFILSIMIGFAANNNRGVVVKDGKDMNVVLSNVCEFYATMMVCEGDSITGEHPVLAGADCMYNYHHYIFYDSLLLFNEARFLKFSSIGMGPGPFDSQTMFVGSENKILSFNATYLTYSCDSVVITPRDSMDLDSILTGQTNSFGLVVLTANTSSDNLYVFDDNFSNLYSLHLNMIPMYLSAPSNSIYCAVIGFNSNLETVFNVINLNTHQIVKDTILGIVSNPISVYGDFNNIFIAYQPGDTSVNIFRYNAQTGLMADFRTFLGTGVNVSTWSANGYNFQPAADVSGSSSDKKVFTWNIFMTQVDSFDIGRRLKSLISPGYNFPYVVAVDSVNPDKAIFYYESSGFQADSFLTPTPPRLFAGDFRCPTKVSEYDDSKVEWKIFPNPSSDDFKLSASGLICGRDYDLDIVDEMGKVVYKATVHSKMTVVLPTSNFEPGVYFVRIHTLKGFITQQIIKQ